MAEAAEARLTRGGAGFMLVRSDRRTLGITVTIEGGVIVRAPRRLAEARVLAFVDERCAWIARAQARMTALPARTPPAAYVDGEVHLHLGAPYRLASETVLRPGVRIEGERLILGLHRPAQVDARAALLEQWRMGEARRVYAERLAALFPPFAAQGFALPPITVRVLKRRWGSMSRDGRMTLSLDLIRAPVDGIDFVIAHELCHLVHFDHGLGFKKLMSETMPDWPARRVMIERALR